MKRFLRILGGVLLAALAAAAEAPAAPASAPADPVVVARRGKEHQHVWVTKSEKKWVDPVKRKELVGYDQNGKPIYKEVIVQPGYWKTITFSVCSVCGKKKN